MKKCIFLASLLLLFFLVSCSKKDTFEVVFETNGGIAIESISSQEELENGIPIPVKDGFIFDGWFFDSEFTSLFAINKITTQTFTLYAKWISETKNYQIETYHQLLDGNYELITTETFVGTTNDTITLSEFNPPIGFEFSQTAEHVLTQELLPDGSPVFKIYYDRINFTITFNTDGGLPIETLTYLYGETISLPTPVKDGYRFIGWDQEIPLTMPATALEFQAIFELIPLYQIDYYDEVDHVYFTQTIRQGMQTTPPENPFKLGYVFLGWTLFDSETTYNFNDLPTNHTSLYAKWTPDIVDYHVYIYHQALTEDFILYDHQVEEDYTETLVNLAPEVYPGFTFNTNHINNILSAIVLPDGTMSLHAYYTRNSYTIHFNANASLSIQSITALYDEEISEPNAPIRPGYAFVGWFIDTDLLIPYVFTTMPAENITLYAKWIGDQNTLSFDSVNGTLVESITAPIGSPILEPVPPTKDGYDFAGWYKDLNYQIPFTTWEMPLSVTTLYAKWVEKSYMITFETNGGQSIDSISIQYTYPIPELVDAVRDNYTFGGWFYDEALLIPFAIDNMPMMNIVVYAKWLDDLDLTTIYYQKSLNRYEDIKVTGIVYALLDLPYQGYVVYDHTGSIVVYDQTPVELGDRVELEGKIYYQDKTPLIINVTSVIIREHNHPLMPELDSSIDTMCSTSIDENQFGKLFSVDGILTKEGDTYYLVDRQTYTKIKLTNYFNFDDFDLLIHLKLQATLMLMLTDDGYVAGLVNYEESIYTNIEILSDVENYILSLGELSYYPYETFVIPSTDPLGLTTLEVSLKPGHETYYDVETETFTETTVPRVVTFNINILINESQSLLQLDIDVEPLTLMSIADFKVLDDGELGVISGIIIFKSNESLLHGLYDGSETIYLYTERYLEVGEEIIVISLKSSFQSVPFIDDEIIRLIKIESDENPIEYPIIEMTDESFLAMDLSDPSTYGQKVELRGFIHETEEHHFFLLELDQKSIYIQPISYAAFEDLFQYIGLEVTIRGYVGRFNETTPLLYIEGIREDYHIPEYTASERVDMILELFSRTYADQEFYSLDEFKLYPYHPVLGGAITYEFIEGGSYYDVINEHFLVVTAPKAIQLLMTITVDDVTQTYLYQTILNPLQVTPISDLKYVSYWGEVYLQGVIVYRSPFVAYLLDDTGMVIIDIYDLDCYTGDEVILYGVVYQSNLFYGQTSINESERQKPIISILSRNNTFTIPMLEGFDALDIYNPESTDPYNRLISLSGTLLDDYGDYYITNGTDQIYIEPADDYTLYKLAQFNGLSVTIKGIVIDYQDNYLIFFGGLEGDLIVNEYSDQDKLDYISGVLSSNTNEPIASETQFVLPITYEFFSATITYTMDSEYDAFYDLLTGDVGYVDEVTEILITATIHLSDLVYQNVDIILTIIPTHTIELVSISDFLILPIKTYQLQAKIIAVTAYDNGYAFIIEDESGKILVPLKSDAYYSNNLMVGRTITVKGHLGINDGRPEVLNADYTISAFSTSVETTFVETTLSEITQYDLYDASVYGMPLLITGTIKRISYSTFVITDGYHQLKLNGVYQSIYNLERYEDLNVILKVFFMGDLDDDGVYDAVITNAFYGGTSTMMYADYSDMDFAYIILDDLIEIINFRTYHAYEYVDLPSYHYFYPSALISYEVVSDPLSSTLSGSNLYFNPVLDDQQVVVELTIIYGTATLVHQITFDLDMADIKSLSDLFLLYPEMDKMGIEGQMIYSSWNYVYLLIDGDVYYIEGYFNNYSAFGEEILIYGKKSIVDDTANYTYDIEILSRNLNNPIILPPSYTPLEDIDLDNLSPSLLKIVLTLYGILRYDEYLGWYYLEPTDPSSKIRVYLRADVIDELYAYAYDFRGSQEIFKYEMDQYLGLPVLIDVLNPGLRILNQYAVVDFVKPISTIALDTLTPEEKIDYGKNYIMNHVSNLDFYPGDYLYNKLPFYHEALQLSFHFELNNPLDETYIDFNEGNIATVTILTTVTLRCVITYYDDETMQEYEGSILLDVNIHPISLSSIYDVLWGKEDTIYQVEGEIIYIFEDQFMLISDGTDVLYVDIYYASYYYGVDLNLNDSVRITAWREYYDWGGYIPMLDDIIEITIITPFDLTPKSPVPLTLNDILELNYLLPSTFNCYMTYTGTLIKVGTHYFSYYIRFEGQNDNTYDLMLMPNMESAELDAILSAYIGQEITVTGYLLGFEFLYQPFDWILLFESFEV